MGKAERGKGKRSHILGSIIRIRSHHYGTLKLRGLTLGDLVFIDELFESETNPHEFTARLIQHQLSSPELSVHDVQSWPDKLLSRVALSWAKHHEAIEQRISQDVEPFTAFKRAVAHYREERNQHLKVTLGQTIDTSHLSSLLDSTSHIEKIIASQNNIAWLLNISSPMANVAEKIDTLFPLISIPTQTGAISPEWLNTSTIQWHLAELARVSTLTESLLDSIHWPNLDHFKDALKTNFIDFSTSYSNLYDSFGASPDLVLSYPPAISRLPALEYFSGVYLLEAISEEEGEITDSEEIQQVREAISAENDDTLPALLQSIDVGLVNVWKGANASLHSDNPDRARHTATSLRELFTHVLHRLAPDEEVRKWSTLPEHYDEKGKPTRRARLLYICREINHGPFSDFVQQDVKAGLEFIQLFQRGTHEITISFTQSQLLALKIKMDSLLRFLIQISQQAR